MGTVSDADGRIEMLMDGDTAFRERNTEIGRADLKDPVLVGNGVVVISGSFGLDREDEIQIEVPGDRGESRALLFGRFGESLIELSDVTLFQEAVGLFFGFDAVEAELIRQPALERLIHPLAPSPGLRGISRDHPDA